jgi:hypothetical protein
MLYQFFLLLLITMLHHYSIAAYNIQSIVTSASIISAFFLLAPSFQVNHFRINFVDNEFEKTKMTLRKQIGFQLEIHHIIIKLKDILIKITTQIN